MKTVFVDVDTQLDFLYPAGALAVPGAEGIIGQLSALTKFAAANKIGIISTADAHPEDDPEFSHWPPHCIAGTFGQAKSIATTLPQSVRIPNTDLVSDQLRAYSNAPQIIIEKQHIDCFTNRNLRPLLDLIAADRYIAYGVVAEVCVEKALFGLLQLGARVEFVTDATKALSENAMRNMVSHFQAAGGILTNVSAVTAH